MVTTAWNAARGIFCACFLILFFCEASVTFGAMAQKSLSVKGVKEQTGTRPPNVVARGQKVGCEAHRES